ncbi:hypothetical protein [Cerasicoccus fimbriatus]|uniref:hypothetical protein n=1 Tax=Cerasicoccus fimbriatus TaxID=3014554 RepID=UPI0022B31BE7|nr:hypothetical protein [Cerasicoccus sp. TK19100]
MSASVPLHWQICRLPVALGDGWIRGFPYFGEASCVLDAWGLYSRCAVLRVLREEMGLVLGDRLYHRLYGESVQLADCSFDCLHTIRMRAR